MRWIRVILRAGLKASYLAVREPSGDEFTDFKILGYPRFAWVDRSRWKGAGPLAEGLDYEEDPVKPEGEGPFELHATRLGPEAWQRA